MKSSSMSSFSSSLLRVTLFSLSDPTRMRDVRDYLTSPSVDRSHIALNVCRCCHVEIEPVLVIWGLSLLKSGQFAEAREKFQGCLVRGGEEDETKETNLDMAMLQGMQTNATSIIGSATSAENHTPENASNMSSSISPGISSDMSFGVSTRHRTVQTIVHLLENQLLHSRSMQSMREKQLHLSYLLLNQTTQTTVQGHNHQNMPERDKSAPDNGQHAMNYDNDDDESHHQGDGDNGGGVGRDDTVLPPRLLQECLYYLRAYGSPLQMVLFYARHGMLNRATTTLYV